MKTILTLLYSSQGHESSDFDVLEALEIMKRGILWAVRGSEKE